MLISQILINLFLVFLLSMVTQCTDEETTGCRYVVLLWLNHDILFWQLMLLAMENVALIFLVNTMEIFMPLHSGLQVTLFLASRFMRIIVRVTILLPDLK